MRTLLMSQSAPVLRRGATLAASALLVLTAAACSSEPDEDQVAAAEALVQQGVSQLGAGENDEAGESFERALRLDDDQILAHYNLGVIDQRANRSEDALDHYEDALALAPDHGPTLYNKALVLEDEDLDEAIAVHRAAVKAQPEYAPGYMRLGFALNHLGQTDEAATHLEKGIALDPAMTEVEAPNYN